MYRCSLGDCSHLTLSDDNQEQLPQGSQNQELQLESLNGQELQEVDVVAASSSSKIVYVKPITDERLDYNVDDLSNENVCYSLISD